jgi:hypothetical protein
VPADSVGLDASPTNVTTTEPDEYMCVDGVDFDDVGAISELANVTCADPADMGVTDADVDPAEAVVTGPAEVVTTDVVAAGLLSALLR